jgi:hypothetical protein
MENKKKITTTIDKDLLEWFKEFSKNEKIPLNRLIGRAMYKYKKNIEKEELI